MKLQSIQVLRGLAALLVVLFHIANLETEMMADNGLFEVPLMTGIILNGYAGVDLFFVISGFIMVYVTQSSARGARAAGSFLFARITRIYPVWWLFAGLMTIYMVGWHGLSGLGLGWDVIGRSEPLIPYLVKSFALMPQGEHPILGVGWTLVHEVYFYLAFTVLMFLPRSAWPAALLCWGASVIVGSLAGLTGPVANDLAALIFYPMTMEFILGALVGLMVTSGTIWRPGLLTQIAVLWLMGSLCLQGVETTQTLEWGRVLWFGLPCALLLYGFGALEQGSRLSWLVPAGVGALVMIVLFQLYGMVPDHTSMTTVSATGLTLTIGALSMALTLWVGWLGGREYPHIVQKSQPYLQGVLSAGARLGDWSFSLYLSHMLVLSALRRIFNRLGAIPELAPVFKLGHPGVIDNVAFLLIGTFASVVISALAYRLFEHPLNSVFKRLRRQFFPASKARLQTA